MNKQDLFKYLMTNNFNLQKRITNNQINLIVIVLILVISACAIKSDQNKKSILPYIVDVESIINNKEAISLSEIATNITYVPLETRSDNLLKESHQIEFTKHFIFVCDRNKLLQFGRNGSFIRQIGKKGRGPGEYSSVDHFSVNEGANSILLLGKYEFNRYDLRGDFIGKETTSYGIDFIIYNPFKVAFYRWNNIENPTNLTITNQALNPLYKFQNNNPRPKTNVSIVKAPLYVFENNLYFKENFNDTLFCVEDSVLKPHIVYNDKHLLLDKGFNLKPTGDLKKQLEKVANKLMIDDIFESKRYVFTSYIRGVGPMAKKDISIILYKNIRHTSVLQGGKFINDIDNGVNIWPKGITSDNFMINCLMPYDLKAHVASNAFKNSTPKYPAKKKELEKLANSLNENDNPVLMLVKLKGKN